MCPRQLDVRLAFPLGGLICRALGQVGVRRFMAPLVVSVSAPDADLHATSSLWHPKAAKHDSIQFVGKAILGRTCPRFGGRELARFPLDSFDSGKFSLYVGFKARSTRMQYTTLPGSGTTGRTGD